MLHEKKSLQREEQFEVTNIRIYSKIEILLKMIELKLMSIQCWELNDLLLPKTTRSPLSR